MPNRSNRICKASLKVRETMIMSRDKCKYFRTEVTEISENISWNMKDGGLSSSPK